MLKKILFLGTIFTLGIILFSFFTPTQAQINPFDLQFPIAELSNCGSVGECKLYCDDPLNISACTTFAEKQGLVTPKEVKKANLAPEKVGPGGCKNASECDSYCRAPEHGEECVLHAVKEGFMSQEDADNILEFMKGKDKKLISSKDSISAPKRGPKEPEFDKEKAKELIEAIGGPGGCSTFDGCDKFCSNPENNDTCMTYAVENKLMKVEDVEKIKKLMTIEGPGGCRGRECESYCEKPGHESECMEFAVDQGFMSKEEFKEAKKFLDASEKGGPGGCLGRECERYCDDPAHGDECFNFAKEHNLLPKEELSRIEKFKEIKSNLGFKGGPGDCSGEAECRTYCSDITHFEECAAFAVNVGFVDSGEAKDALRQFVEIEKFKPQGMEFGRPNENFVPPQGFRPQGENFGPNGVPDKFMPPLGLEKELEDRFKEFEQFRSDFERMPPPPEFKNGVQQGFNPPQGFEGGFPPPNNFSGNGELRPDMKIPLPGQFPPPGRFEGFIPPNTEGGYIKPTDTNFIPPTGDRSYPVPTSDFIPYTGQSAYPYNSTNGAYLPPTGDFTQPSGYPPPSTGDFIPPPTTSSGSYPPPSGEGSYIPPSDQTMLLPTVLFPLLPFLKILF